MLAVGKVTWILGWGNKRIVLSLVSFSVYPLAFLFDLLESVLVLERFHLAVFLELDVHLYGPI